jgi:hypothetical protein
MIIRKEVGLKSVWDGKGGEWGKGSTSRSCVYIYIYIIYIVCGQYIMLLL